MSCRALLPQPVLIVNSLDLSGLFRGQTDRNSWELSVTVTQRKGLHTAGARPTIARMHSQHSQHSQHCWHCLSSVRITSLCGRSRNWSTQWSSSLKPIGGSQFEAWDVFVLSWLSSASKFCEDSARKERNVSGNFFKILPVSGSGFLPDLLLSSGINSWLAGASNRPGSAKTLNEWLHL